MATARSGEAREQRHGDNQSHGTKTYQRSGAMILTAMVVMYGVMSVSSYEWGNARRSESSMFMALIMGGTMGLVMPGWMLTMFRNAQANVRIVVASIVLLGVGVFLDRGQTTVRTRAG